MGITKCVKATVLASVLVAGSMQALPLLSPEAGVLVGTSYDAAKSGKISGDTSVTYGVYARLWLKPGSFRIAPFVKWENVTGFSRNNAVSLLINGGKRTNNLQYGAVVGFEFFYLTPYVGLAYSQFTDTTISNTWALNYGLKLKVPILPLTVGVDASWQRPKVLDTVDVDMHRVSLTFGLQF